MGHEQEEEDSDELSQSWDCDPWERPDLHQPRAVRGPAGKYSCSATAHLLPAGCGTGAILLSSLELPQREDSPRAAGTSQIIPKTQILAAEERRFGSNRTLPCSVYPFRCWEQWDFGERMDSGLSWEGSFALPAHPEQREREVGMRWLLLHIVPGGSDSALTAPCDPVHQLSQDPKLSPAPSLRVQLL